MRANAAGVSRSSRSGATSAAQTTAAATRAVSGARTRRVRAPGAGAVEPADVAAERLGQQQQGDADARPCRPAGGSRPGRRDGEHDALHGGDDLAPSTAAAAARPATATPSRRPAARSAPAPIGQHPAAVVAGHRDAQHQDEEGVDLAVEAGAERRSPSRCAAPPGRRRRRGRARRRRGRRAVAVRIGRSNGVGDERGDAGGRAAPG